MQAKPILTASFFVCLLFFISFFLIQNVLAIDSPTNYCTGSYISTKTSVSASQESACGHASTDSANSGHICPANPSKQPANLTKLEDKLKNPFYASFIPTATCTENGGWCSCYLGCSTAECCSGNCEYYTCMDYGCYQNYPNLCDGYCYAACDTGFVCDPTYGPVCCPSEYPYYCYIDNSCWSELYLPNPCGSGCPPGSYECDGNCYTCTDPNDVFICDSGTPYCLPPHTDIRVESFISTPTQIDAGDYVSFTARLKNYGGIAGTTKVEAAIIPTTFWSSSLNYTPESYVDTAKCCPGNTYFQAKEVTLNPWQEEDITFTVKAPTPSSIDACDEIEPIRSAWGSLFKYEAGTYDVCGGGYTSQIETTGPIICDYAPACTYTDDDDCLDSNTVKNYYKETLCEGGCSAWKYTTYDCASGFFCKDPGNAYCNSCSTSCDSICQSSACYGTDPDCASDGSLQSCGGSSGPCDGEITTIVKDNNGNPISGIKVYIDGTYKGITDSYGKFTTSTSDSYCGVSHNIKTYCSDSTYCGSSSTTINYNNDVDDVNFNCQVCVPYPELEIYVDAPTSYELNDKITLEITVKDDADNLIPNAYIRVCDPFHEIGCPSQYSYGYTGTNGKIQHISYATKLGAHTFKISASKDDYKPDTTTKTVTVGSFDGEINVNVKDLSEKAIIGSSVYLDSKYIGKTDSYGKRTLYPSSPGSYEIKVNCPAGALCGTQTVDVTNSEATVDFQCDCAVPVGDLRVDVVNENDYPIANVYVFLDDIISEEYITNAFGTTYIAGIPQGNHNVEIVYNITNESYSGVYHNTQTITIGSGINILKFTEDPTTAQKRVLASNNGTEQTIVVIPFLIAAAAPVVDVISIGMSIEDYCKCAYETESGINTCISTINDCISENDIRNCVGGFVDNAIDKTGKCKLEAAFLVGDLASPLMPVGLVGHFAVYVGKELKWVDEFVPGTRIIYDKATGLWQYTKKLGENLIDSFAKWIGNIFKKIIVIGTEEWSDDALKGIENIATHSGKEAANSFFTVVKKEFGEEYAQRIAKGIKQLDERNVKGLYDSIDEYGNTRKGLVSDIARFAEKNDIGNLKGHLFELEVASHSNYLDDVNEVALIIMRDEKNRLTDLDVVLKDKTIVETKNWYWPGWDEDDAIKKLDDQIRRLNEAKELKNLENIELMFKNDPPTNGKVHDWLELQVILGRISEWSVLK